MMALRAAVSATTNPLHYRPWLTTTKARQSKQNYTGSAVGVPREPETSFQPTAAPCPGCWCGSFIATCKVFSPKAALWTSRNGKLGSQPAQGHGCTGSLTLVKERCSNYHNAARVSRVMTIDTALVHLCAAAGHQADMLLSAFHDERWQELHRPEHHYGQLIKLWRSSQFGSWSTVLDH